MKISPIAIFTYGRPDHTKQVLLSLKGNNLAQHSSLYIFSDAPKKNEDIVKVKETRKLLDSLDGFGSIKIIYREKNMGLANNIIDGVNQLINTYGQVIVLEDDLLLSPYFLQYMNESLIRYRDNPRVCSIHGYSFPTKNPLPNNFFFRGADCWGWATWKRAWDDFEPNGQVLLSELQQKKLCHAFDLDGLVPYTQMLKDQIAGKNNSWAIRWHAMNFLKERLTLFPGTSLVNNIGTDNSGQHCEQTDVFTTSVSKQAIVLDDIQAQESLEARETIKDFYRSIKPSILSKIVAKVQREIFFKKHGT